MLTIFGANGKSGRKLIARLSADGFSDSITAVLRRPEQAEDPFFKQHGANTATADVLDAQACAAVIRDSKPQTVVSFVGGKNEEGIRSDALGNINIIAATKAANPQARFVLITSMGCGEQWDMMSEPFKQALGEAVRAKTEAEIYLKQSGLNWTILRPCGLADGEDNAYTLTQNAQEIPQKYMTRNGLAAAVAAIVGQADSKGETYSVGAA